MRVDYHVHTKWCNHASGEMKEYVEAGVKEGLDEIGFAAHMPFMQDADLALTREDVPMYVENALLLKESFASSINVRVGAECDHVPGMEEEIGQFLAQYDFDYVFGSVHYLDQWGFDQPRYVSHFNDHDIDQLYSWYFDVVAQAMATGLFQVVSHLDLIKKFNFRPKQDIADILEKLAGRLKAADVCVEINSAGLRYECNEVYPGLSILKVLSNHGVPITFGSDAHKPGHVAENLETSIALAREAGYSKFATFDQKQRSLVSLPPACCNGQS